MVEKNNPTIALNILYTKERKKYVNLISQKLFEFWKTNHSINDSKDKEGWHDHAVKNCLHY